MKRILLLIIFTMSSFVYGEEFPISFWCGPPAKFVTLERYQEIKDAGFTFAMPGCSGATPEVNKKILDYCQQVGLKAIVMEGRIPRAIGGNENEKKNLDAVIADYAKHPAMMGYFIVDEPNAAAFKGLGEVVAYLKEKDPAHISFINLMPNYATLAQIGSPTYKDHLEKFVSLVKPPFVSYDHYGFFDSGDRPGFYENLQQVRDVSQANNLPFWNIVQCVQWGIMRNLTEGELRYEAMQTLAYGGKGLLWFTYWSPHDADKTADWKHAMIDENGKKEPHYDMIKSINADVEAIGSELMKAKSTSVFHTAMPAPEKSPIKFSLPHVTVGVFKGADGKTLALVANQDYKNPIETSAEIQSPDVQQFDPKTHKWVMPDLRNPDFQVFLHLPPGGAVLLRW